MKAASYLDTEAIDKILEIAAIDAHALPKHRPSDALTGVYFLFDGDDIVYVGKSKDILNRIPTHKATKKYDSHSFILCEEELLNVYERVLINKYKPIYNKDSITMAIRRSDELGE